jgi:hypothetical protein
MIYLIAAQPPPSAQDFSDLEQALVEGKGDEDAQAKTESIKAALQWVRRFESLRRCMPRTVSFFVQLRPLLRRVSRVTSSP